MKALASLLTLAVLLAAAPRAYAERYRVDLIVFLDKGAGTAELAQPARAPDLNRALELDSAALLASGIRLVPENEFALNDQWARLRNSARYQPLIKLAWSQSDPPVERTLPLHLRAGSPLPLPTAPGAAPASTFIVDGTVALRLSRYLYLDADLAYTQPNSEGLPVSYRLKEVRRMRRDELHHLDSPRLGVLAMVVKVPELPGAAAPATTAATPAKPGAPQEKAPPKEQDGVYYLR